MNNVIEIDIKDINIDKINVAAELIKEGKLVAFPTETVYGIGANALDRDAVNKIFKIKQRPANDPIIVHISNINQITDIAINVPEIAFKLAKKFWPGPLTLILKRNEKVPSNVSSDLPTIAVRMPSHKIALSLIESAQRPIAAPSANMFTKPSSTRGAHVVEDFKDQLDLIIDGGEADIGVESTVLDLNSEQPTVLRPGGLSIEDIKSVVPELKIHPKYIDTDSSSSSPGMLTKHYSPKANLLMYEGDSEEQKLEKMLEEASRLSKEGHLLGFLAHEEQVDKIKDSQFKVFNLGSNDNFEDFAKNLYDGMRSLDKENVDTILVSAPNKNGLGLAIWDRLFRAAECQIR